MSFSALIFHPILILAILLCVPSCKQASALTLSSQWQASEVSQWKDERPDMLVFSQDGKFLFVSCETRANMLSPSLVRIDLQTGKKETILYGLARADGLKMDQDGAIWLGEEVTDGLVIRLSSPSEIPSEQRLDRDRLISSHPDIKPVKSAGRFSHEGMAFSKDGKYLYLADEWSEGCLYRYTIHTKQLQVFHASKGWLNINTPAEARFKAEVLHGKYFNRLEDMETLPDGRILLAETGSKKYQGRIWALDDQGATPKLTLYLKHPDIIHPDNLEWDQKHGWLWITDDDSPSRLWVWNGENIKQIASHRFAEITGIETGPDGAMYFNIQGNRLEADATFKIRPVVEK